jgi:hypothetical protein
LVSLSTDLDRIITQIVKPKVSVYMAIDGVAPRAKMNQQRSRRFRSAKDLAEATKDKRIVPTDGSSGADAADPYSGAFDSNCITPGTEFLLRISECIRYFIRKKIKEDPLWKNLSVIFSGPEVPGEGEHKVSFEFFDCILSYLRLLNGLLNGMLCANHRFSNHSHVRSCNIFVTCEINLDTNPTLATACMAKMRISSCLA